MLVEGSPSCNLPTTSQNTHRFDCFYEIYGKKISVSVNRAVESAAEDAYVGQSDAGTGDALSSSLVAYWRRVLCAFWRTAT